LQGFGGTAGADSAFCKWWAVKRALPIPTEAKSSTAATPTITIAIKFPDDMFFSGGKASFSNLVQLPRAQTQTNVGGVIHYRAITG
jgi:hypothetical protein